MQLLANPLTFLEEVTHRHGKVVGMVLGGERVVLVADANVAEQVLISGNSTVAKVWWEICLLSDKFLRSTLRNPSESLATPCRGRFVQIQEVASPGTSLLIMLYKSAVN